MSALGSFSVLGEVAVATVRQRWTAFAGSFVALVLGTGILATSILTLAATGGEGLAKARSVAQVTTAMSLMVVVFVLIGTFAFVVDQRGRELALLSLLGTTPSRIRRLILIETVIVGALAAATGCLLGIPGAFVLRWWMVDTAVSPESYAIGLHPGAVAIAFLVGIGAAVVGASTAAWRASRARPLDALREASASPEIMTRTRWVVGAVVLIGAFMTAFVMTAVAPASAASPSAFFAVPVLCAVGLALLAPALCRPVARAATRSLDGRGAVAMVVRQGVQNGGRRVAALVSPVVLAVGMFAGMLSMEHTGRAATADLIAGEVDADLVALPAGGGRFDEAGLRALRDQHGTEVGTVHSERVMVRVHGQRRFSGIDARSISPGSMGTVFTPHLQTGSTQDFTARDIVVSQNVASERDLAVGDAVSVRLAGAPRPRAVEVRVAAVVKSVVGGGDAYVSDALPGARLPDRAFVRLDRGTTAVEVADALADRGVRVAPFSSFVAEVTAEEARTTRLANVVILGIAVLYALLAIANTMLMNASARSHELAALGYAGATDRTVLRILIGEALVVVAVGSSVGMVAVAAAQGLQRMVLAAAHVWPRLSVPWLPVLVVVCGCAAASTGAVLLAHGARWRAARR